MEVSPGGTFYWPVARSLSSSAGTSPQAGQSRRFRLRQQGGTSKPALSSSRRGGTALRFFFRSSERMGSQAARRELPRSFPALLYL